jgi:ribosomal protein S6--L-glutamate ligase
MRLLILSRSKALHSTKRLIEEAQKKGVECLVVNPLRCQLSLNKTGASVYVHNRLLEGVDVVLPRIGTSITEFGLLVVRHFEMMNVQVLNDSDAILNSRNKFRSLQTMAQKHLDIPTTVLTRSTSDIPGAMRQLGRPPIVMKVLQGSQGIGVMMAPDRSTIDSVHATMVDLDKDILLQQFIREAKGSDIRVFIVGDKVVGSMRRLAKAGEFRANIHRGGGGVKLRLPKRYERLALNATKAIGLDIAGVDILESSTGPKILEINSSPGFEGLEKATGINIAEKIIALAIRRARRKRASRRN